MLASILAGDATLCPGRSTLIVKQHLRDAATMLFEAIASDPASVFAQHALLTRPARYKRRQRAFADRRRRSTLLRMVDECAPRQALVFNEDALDQSLAHRVHSRGGAVFGVEDGAIAYSADRRHISTREARKLRFWFGPRIEARRIEGASSDLDGFYALFPEVVRTEIGTARTRPIPRAVTDRLAWLPRFLDRLAIDPSTLACDGLVALSRSNNFRHLPDYGRDMHAVLSRLAEHGGHWAIKYHPNEKQPDPLGASALGFSIIDRHVPVEAIYRHNATRLQTVVGDIGTALMSARWLVPQADTLSLMHYLAVDDPPFEQALHHIGVRVITHPGQVPG